MSGTLRTIGETDVRGRGSLAVSNPRTLIFDRSVRAGFASDGSVDPETLRVTGKRNRTPDEVKSGSHREVVEEIDDEVVWGGAIVNHFGHFMTESVSRLWPLLPGGPLEGHPVVFTTPTRQPYAREWLEAFGAKLVELPEDGSVRFERVLIPESSWRLNSWITPEAHDIHMHARDGLDVPSSRASEILWLSRSRLEADRRTYDERLLELLLEEWITPTFPEQLTLAEQVAAIEGAESVAGTLGSAFHLLLLARNSPNCLFLCPGRVMSSYFAQDRLLSLSGEFVHAIVTAEMRLLSTFRVPGTFRISIPETLRALRTAFPALEADRRLTALSYPERPPREGVGEDVLEGALAAAVIDPLSVRARVALGASLEKAGHDECALEQFSMVADLSQDYGYAPLRAARLLARLGNRDAAADMAGRVLAIQGSSEREEQWAAEASRYLTPGEGEEGDA